jgi:hypothetical protein
LSPRLRRCLPEPIKNLYYWQKKRNFGDELGNTLLDFLKIEHQWAAPEDADLVIAGSVLEHLPKGWGGTICGAGKLHENSKVDLTGAHVVALRGKLTADSVRGLSGPIVVGDPGLLVPDWIEQPVAKYELGVLPHWSDHELAGRFLYGQVINAQDDPEKVALEIARCKRLITSSLHGIVVADAFGIPRRAELFPRAAAEGGDFKYRDYSSVYDTHPHFGEMWRAPHYMVERLRGQLRSALAGAVGTAISQPAAPPPCTVYPRQDGLPPRISLLVPFRYGQDSEHRGRVWEWLVRFWRSHLPTAEIVMGYDQGWMFSKSRAINRAAQQACGEVFAILDADAFLDPQIIEDCATNIRTATGEGRRLWYVPYRRLYRLGEEFTLDTLSEDPSAPYRVSSPPAPGTLEERQSANINITQGYRFGAMLQIMPAEAFFMAGGMDPRFQGWGGEDAAFMRAVDTIYSCHEVTNNDICHLWHERPGKDWRTRRWVGQQVLTNVRLAQRYGLATGEATFMRGLVAEHSVFGAGFSAAPAD